MNERKPPYSISYYHEGAQYGALIMYATSWEDAEARLQSLKRTGKIDGSNVSIHPVNDFTTGPVGLWVMFKVWIMNAIARVKGGE